MVCPPDALLKSIVLVVMVYVDEALGENVPATFMVPEEANMVFPLVLLIVRLLYHVAVTVCPPVALLKFTVLPVTTLAVVEVPGVYAPEMLIVPVNVLYDEASELLRVRLL